MTTILRAGQKFRFLAKNGRERAIDLELGQLKGACEREGNEIVLICDVGVTFTPLNFGGRVNGAAQSQKTTRNGDAANACESTRELDDASPKSAESLPFPFSLSSGSSDSEPPFPPPLRA